MSETVARMDAGPEPTWTYLRRVSAMIPVLPVRHTLFPDPKKTRPLAGFSCHCALAPSDALAPPQNYFRQKIRFESETYSPLQATSRR